jgi:RHS repeat-associated protein
VKKPPAGESSVEGAARPSLNISPQQSGNWAASGHNSATQADILSSNTAAKAVDGDVDGDLDLGHTAATNSHQNSWWQTDLQSVQTISSITVWGRTDCCPAMTSDYYVFVSDTPFTSTDLSTTLSQSGVSNYYHSGFSGPTSSAGATSVNINRTGRYLRVQLTGTNSLALAEVQVWSQAAKLEWLVTDQLGTPRIAADKTGNLAGVSRHDYLPFGEELSVGRSTVAGYSTADGVRQKFTDKERDNENGLDYFLARYYSTMQGRFTSVDSIKLTAERLSDPQRLNLYEYCGNSPLRYIDPDGEDLVLANAAARARAIQVLSPGLSAAEKQNITIQRGKVQLRNPNAIDASSASPAYRYLAQIIGDHKLQLHYYAIAPGQTVTAKDGSKDGLLLTYSDVVKAHGFTTALASAQVRSVIVPVGGAAQVLGLPTGSGNKIPDPEDVIFAHEAYGHALNNDAIGVENEYRRTRNLPLDERSGEDHVYNVRVTADPDLIETRPMSVVTEFQRRRLTPVSPPPR